MRLSFPPTEVVMLLVLQLVGVFLLVLARYGNTPILIFALFSLGSLLVVVSILTWIYIVIREIKTIMKEIRSLFLD